MGAVEDVVDVVGRVGDVLNGTGAVKAQLVAALAAVTVVRHNAELKVDRAVGRGEEAGDGDIDLRIGAAAAQVIIASPSNTVRLRMGSKASWYTMTSTQPPQEELFSVAMTLATV